MINFLLIFLVVAMVYCVFSQKEFFFFQMVPQIRYYDFQKDGKVIRSMWGNNGREIHDVGYCN